MCVNFCRDNEKTCALYSPVTGRDTEPANDVKKASKDRQTCSKKATKNIKKHSKKRQKITKIH